jgi:putative ABC transport system permease protein
VSATPLDAYYRTDRGELRFLIVMVGVITLSVLLLSAAGISAMMSFAVTRRQREIGVRTALGATKGQLMASIFTRSSRGLTVGALLGVGMSVLVDRVTGGAMLGGRSLTLLAVAGSIMLVSGALATVAPARRALRLQAIDLMRDE